MATEARIILAAEDRASRVLAQVKGEFAGMSSGAALLKTSLASLTAGLSVGALVAFARNVANGLDALNDMSDATGATVENLSALEDVAARNGTSLDTVSTAMVKFNSVLTAAQEPGSQAANVLKAIGLNAKELQALDPAEALRRTAVALTGFADDGNKARVVQELFGKSIKEVAPFLKDLAEQQQLNAKVTTEQAKAAEAFNKEIFALQKNFTDLGRYMAGDFITAINAAAKAMRESGFMAGMGVLFGGDAGHRQNKEFAQLTGDKIGLERSLAEARNAGVKGQYVANIETRLADVNRQLDAIMRERQSAPTLPRRPGQIDVPSIGNVPTATPPKGSTGKTDAQRERERMAAEDTRGWVAYADAVLAEGERVDEGLRKILEDEDKYREQMRQKDLAGWVAYAEARVQEDFDMTKDLADQQIAAAKASDDLVKKNAEEAQRAAKELGLTFASAFEDAIVGGKKFSEVLQGLGQDITRIVLRKQVTEPFADAITGGLKDGDLFGSLGGFFSKLFSFDGGGSTGSGPRSGGLDGKGGFLAMMHPQETVTDHTKPGGARGVTLINSPVFHVDSRTDQGAVLQIMQQGFEANNKQMIGLLQKQGVLAS